MNKRKPTLSDDQLYALEEHLAGTLKPVTPPLEVVQRLRERIRFPQPEEIAWRLRDWNRMFLIFGGVFSFGGAWIGWELDDLINRETLVFSREGSRRSEPAARLGGSGHALAVHFRF